MEPIMILIAVIIALVVLSLGRLLAHSMKTLFYVLLVGLILVFVFGVSLGDILDWISELILMVL